jgi:hypothetical protein
MQEVPPSTPSADRPRRRRFINLLIAILLLFTIGTALMVIDLLNSYLWAGEGEETSWGRGILMISTWAFVNLKFCIPALFRYWSNAEIERLLPEFVQVSDHFTRPKHYIHRALIGNATTGYAESFIRQLGAYSDGSLQTPTLADRDGKTGHITYKVIGYIRHMSDVANEAQRDGINVIHVRVVTDPDTTCEQTDDISLEGMRLEAFIKTLELSSQFRINPTAW